MTNSRELSNSKIDAVGEEIKRIFERAGEDAKQQVMSDFNSILANDLSELEQNISRVSLDTNKRIIRESEKGLKRVLKQQFGDSVFGSVLTEAILPTIFKGFDGKSRGFNSGDSQKFLEIGKAISKSQSRNG